MLNPLTYASSPAYPYLTASLPAVATAALVHFACSRYVIARGRGGYRRPAQADLRTGSIR